jgi:hypothetical protein
VKASLVLPSVKPMLRVSPGTPGTRSVMLVLLELVGRFERVVATAIVPISPYLGLDCFRYVRIAIES